MSFLYTNWKSTFNPSELGSIDISFLPSVNSTFFTILRYFLFAWRSFKPALLIVFTNSLDEPSIMGISGLLISINALSTPVMYSAASKCSTVETDTPNLFSKVVQSLALETFLKFALIKLFSFKSILLKTIP